MYEKILINSVKIPSLKHEMPSLLKGKSPAVTSIISIIIGYLLAFFVMLAVSPSNAATGFATLFTGGLNKGMLSVGDILFTAGPLICVGMSVALASKSGAFNIGGSGQFMFAGCMALYMAHVVKGTGFLGFLICLLTGMLAGALWALIPALLEVFCKVNIVVSTIMMNYVAVYLTAILTKEPFVYDNFLTKIDNASIKDVLVPQWGINNAFTFKVGGAVIKSSIDIGIIIAILAAIIMWFIYKHTSLGFQIKASGQGSTAAKEAGISNHKSVIISMCLAGAMAGLGAVLYYMAHSPYNFTGETKVIDIGFQGISVGMIANNNPLAIIFSAILISYLEASKNMLSSVGFNSNITDIITSVIIYCVGISILLKNFYDWIIFKRNQRKEHPALEEMKKADSKAKGENK